MGAAVHTANEESAILLTMADVSARLQEIIEEITGNEALLEMLETEAATEMLNWGTEMATSLVKKTKDEAALLPRLKAVRQTMRSVGNWAAGKYVDPADRVRLRDNLLQHFKVIYGEDANLPPAEKLGELINQVDDHTLTPYQLVKKLRSMLESYVSGGIRA